MKIRMDKYAGMLAVTVIAATAALPAGAAEGRIPIWQPMVLSVPGSYVVTRDIVAADGPLLDIQVGGVSVDLNGHTLTLTGVTGPAIQIGDGVGTGPQSFRIANGTIVGGMYGIHVLDMVPHTVSLMHLGIVGAASAAVKVDHLGDLAAKGIIIIETRTAFELAGPSPAPDGERPAASIRDSMIHADIGVSCTGVSCDVTNNTVASCGSAVLLMGADESEVSGNTILLPGSMVCFNPQPEPPGDTIHVERSVGVRVSDNRLHGSPTSTGSNHGITTDATSNDALIADNQIIGYGDDGMHLMSSGAIVRDNLVNRNMGNGIWLGGGRCLVDDNTITGNSADGIVFSTADNIYRNNMLLGNMNAASGVGLLDTIDGGGNIQ